MTEVDLKWLEELIKRRYGEKDEFRLLAVDVTLAVRDGDNFISKIYRLDLKTSTHFGKNDIKSIILKRKVEINLEDKSMEKKLSDAFNKEYEVYLNVLTSISTCLPYHVRADSMWAECLGFIPNKDIYFEDLKVSGYDLADRLVGLDLDHCLLVFQSLAEFHAASYIAISKGEIDTHPYSKYLVTEVGSEKKTVEVNEFDIMVDIIRHEWGSQWADLADKLEKCCNNLDDMIKQVAQVSETRINVFCHGDTWTNNFMFKRDINGKPVSFKFVDFQISHYNSFCFDLCYLLASSINPDLKRQYLNTWIQLYCQTFSQCLKEHDSNLPCPTPDMVKQELTRLAPFSLLVSIRLRPIFMIPPEDSLPITEILKDTGLHSIKRRLFNHRIITEVAMKELPDILSVIQV